MLRSNLFFLAISLIFTNALMCPEFEPQGEEPGKPEETGRGTAPSETMPPVQGAPEPPVEEGAPTTVGGLPEEQPVVLPTGKEGASPVAPLEVEYRPEQIAQAVFNLSTMTPAETDATFASIEKGTVEPKTLLQAITNLINPIRDSITAFGEGLASKARVIVSRIAELVGIFEQKVIESPDTAQPELLGETSKLIDLLETGPSVNDFRQARDSVNGLARVIQSANRLSELGGEFGFTFKNGITLKSLTELIQVRGPQALERLEKIYENNIGARRADISPQEALTDPILKSLQERLELTRESYRKFDVALREARFLVISETARLKAMHFMYLNRNEI